MTEPSRSVGLVGRRSDAAPGSALPGPTVVTVGEEGS